MGLPFHLLLPLAAAIVFVVGALLLKRASDLGADVWRTTRIINYTTALVATPLWLLGGTIPSASLWWQPAVAGILFFAGQVFSLLALSTGDVSVATPVLGVKILLVALLTALLIGDPIGARLWTAAALSSAAIALLNIGGAHPHRRVGTTIVLAALGATAYACFDVLSRSGRLCGGRPARADRDGMRGGVFTSPSSVRRTRKNIRQRVVARLHPWLAAGAACSRCRA